MPFTVQEVDHQDPHRWAVVQCTCDLSNDNDPFLIRIIEMIREAYGEHTLIAAALALVPDPSVQQRFNTDALRKAVRLGMPEPSSEAAKRPHLTNYRSETTEIIARGALAESYKIEFPYSPQAGKPNANMPVLGFDGWGILTDEQLKASLVLVQVKGTEDVTRPPAEAEKLIEECKKVPRQVNPICRALSALVNGLHGSPLQPILLKMLETLGDGGLPNIIVAPVIVRGTTPSHKDDLTSLRDASAEYIPAKGYGVTVSIGVSLTDFGHRAMSFARLP